MAPTHYPPSKLRYMARNPCITFNVSAEMKKKIEEVCRVEGLSKARLVKNFFFDFTKAFDDLKQAHIKEIDDLKAFHAVKLEYTKKIAYMEGILSVQNEMHNYVRTGFKLCAAGMNKEEFEVFLRQR